MGENIFISYNVVSLHNHIQFVAYNQSWVHSVIVTFSYFPYIKYIMFTQIQDLGWNDENIQVNI